MPLGEIVKEEDVMNEMQYKKYLEEKIKNFDTKVLIELVDLVDKGNWAEIKPFLIRKILGD